MKSKMTSSVSPASESGFRKVSVHTLQEFYKPLVQKLSWSNMSAPMKRNLKMKAIHSNRASSEGRSPKWMGV